MTHITKLPLTSIRLDGGTQARESINQGTVAEYAAAINEGAEFPAVIVFFDGADNWLGDGFHRFLAHKHAGRLEIAVEVRQGTRRDAIEHACGANAHHGLPRSNADKRKAVLMLLADAEWAALSDREVAKKAGVAHSFVASVRDPERAQAQQQARDRAAAKRLESDSTPAANPESDSSPATPPRPVVSAAGAAVVIEPAKDTPPAGPTEDEQIAADAHGDTDIATLLEETQRELEAAQRQIQAMSADDQRAETLKWQRMADVAARRQEEIQDRLVEREAELSRLMKTLRRIGTAVGEDDPTKVAATVESFVRAMKVPA